MLKRFLLPLLLGLALTGCQTLDPAVLGELLPALTGRGELSGATIAAGLADALEVGTRQAVAQTSRDGGFGQNPAIRIPLPSKLQGMADGLRKIGFGASVDRFENQMNLAAEQAAGQAAPLFIDAIKQMSIADAQGILSGGEHAATAYFRKVCEPKLQARFRPVAARHMQELGVVTLYGDLLKKYKRIPFAPQPTVSIEEYVANAGVDGLFHVLAQEEAKIRRDPAACTTELLRRVFGQ